MTALSDEPRAIRVADKSNGNQPANTGTTVQFLPASPANPGGLKGYNHSLYFKSEPGLAEGSKDKKEDKKLNREGKTLKHKEAVERQPVPDVTPSKFSKGALKNLTQNRLGKSSMGARSFLMQATAGTTDAVQAISGYVYGALTYPSFVTQGAAL